MTTDYYETLGVPRTATPDEIRKAYRLLARKYHPDVNPDGREEAEAKFKEVSQAHAVLSDEQKRAVYDRYGADAVNGMGGQGAAGADFSGGIGDSVRRVFWRRAGRRRCAGARRFAARLRFALRSVADFARVLGGRHQRVACAVDAQVQNLFGQRRGARHQARNLPAVQRRGSGARSAPNVFRPVRAGSALSAL